jgi:hypothetical protein
MARLPRQIAWLVAAAIMTLPLCTRAAEKNADQWRFTLAPYAWLAGQSGSVGTLPGLPPADIDVDFHDDILGNINGALFLLGEVRKGKWGGMVDIAYTDIEDEDATPVQILWKAATVQTTSWIVSAAGLYRFWEEDRAYMEGVAGVRYWRIDSRIALSGGPAPAVERTNKEDWIDPVLGLKGRSFLGGSKFFVDGGLTVGGFTVGSDFMWDAYANLGYQWTRTFATTVGYRYLDVDYSNDGFVYDVAQDGILLGLGWQW